MGEISFFPPVFFMEEAGKSCNPLPCYCKTLSGMELVVCLFVCLKEDGYSARI